MIKEIDLFGVFLPPILLYALIAGAIWLPLRVALDRAGLDRVVWHPALFGVALYVVLLAAVTAMLT